MNKKYKVITVWILVVCLLAASIMPAVAERDVSVLSDDIVTRISNPDNEPGQADGLIPLGDRTAGYGWALAERGDYIYIGTWRNTVGAVVESYILPAFNAGGDNTELFWALADVFTNGDIPRYDEGFGGEIVKMNKKKPGEFETVFECEDSFRNVVAYGDDLYFSTYAPLSGNPATIYKLDDGDQVTAVYESYQGSSLRANAVLGDKLYFAGTSVSKEEKDDISFNPAHAKLAVIEKHTEDDGFDLVADDEDFGAYCDDPYVTAVAGSPFWDMIAFKGELYASIPGTRGYVVFAGHPAEDGEEANKYGWNWREVVGAQNGVNYPGNANNVEEQEFDYNEGGYYGAGEAGYLSVISAFAVFNDELYIYDIDHTIVAEVYAVLGIASMLMGGDGDTDLKTFFKPLHSTITHPQRLWKLGDDGKCSEVTGFTELMKNTCNEYVWKSGVYDDTLYIGTMDSKVIYNYVTRFTGASIFDMSVEEWESEIGYIKNLIGLINQTGMLGERELPEEKLDEALDKLLSFITWYDNLDKSIDKMTVEEFLRSLFISEEEAYALLEKAKEGSEEFSEKAKSAIEKLDEAKEKLGSIQAVPGAVFALINLFSNEEMLDSFAAVIDMAKSMVAGKVRDIENQYLDTEAIAKDIEAIDSKAIASFLQPLFAKLVENENWESTTEAITLAWESVMDKGLSGIALVDEFLKLMNDVNNEIPWDDIADLIDLIYDNTIAEDLGAAAASFGNLALGMVKRYARNYINKLLDGIDLSTLDTIVSVAGVVSSMDEDTLSTAVGNLLTGLINQVFDRITDNVENETVLSAVDRIYHVLYSYAENLTDEQKKSLASLLQKVCTPISENVDVEALQMYLDISKVVRDDVQGFDIVKSTDGENWEVVTDDGFGDKWNYGALRFLPTDRGMYITTANPFYGTQLYLLTNGNEEYDDDPDEDEYDDDPDEDDIDDTEDSYDDFEDYSVPMDFISQNYDFFHEEEGYGRLNLNTYPDLKKGTAYSRLIDGTTNYVSEKESDDMPMVYYYSDHFFDFPATEYNPHLNTLSATISSVSIASHRADGSDTERAAGDIDSYKYKSRNVQEMLYYMGFEEIFVNESYTTEPGLDTVGLVIANKKIKDAEGKESTLVVLTPRNAGYLNEWYNNFDFGSEGNHNGFQTVADKAYATLLDYISDHGITGDIKLWLAGTSRGAGITNVLSGMLDDSSEIAALGIEKEDIYSYNIGSPRAVYIYDEEGNSKELHSEKYSNIMNVAFDFDMVANILPNVDNGRGWNFERYGQDIILSMGDEKDEYDYRYTQFMENLEDFMKQMLVINPYSSYFGPDQVAEDYLPLKYQELGVKISLATVPEILDIAYEEERIDQETYLELASEYAELAQDAQDALMGMLSGEGSDVNVAGFAKDAAQYLAKLVKFVGADTVAKNLVKAGFGEIEDSTETYAAAIKRFNKSVAYSTTRQKYGERYNDAIATIVDIVEYIDSSDMGKFTGNIMGGLTGIFTDIRDIYARLSASTSSEDEETQESEALFMLQAIDDENTDPLEKARLAAELLKKIFRAETSAGEAIARAADDLESLDPAISAMLTTEDGKAVIRFLLRIATASMRFPEAFGFSPFESIGAVASFATGVNFMFSAHDAGVFVGFARLFDSFYDLDNGCESNPYSDLNSVTDYEKLGYRTVKLPEADGLKVTVSQVNTSKGSNSKVENGTVLTWNKKDGVKDRKDPGVFVTVYDKGTSNPTVSYDKGTFLFLPLDHEYEISISADKAAEFDLPVYEHSLLGSYEVGNIFRVVDSDENSDVSHKGIKMDTCDTLKMKAEGFDAAVLSERLYGKDGAAANFLIPFSKQDGAAYYPITLICSKTEPEPSTPEPEPSTPDKEPGKNESPKTGDDLNQVLMLILMLSSAAGIFVLAKKRKENR